MGKSHVGLKENLARVILALLVLSILVSIVAIAPLAKAQDPPRHPTPPPTTPTPSPSPKPSSPTPSPSENTWIIPNYPPPPTESGGFWSPLTIGIVAVSLVTFTILGAFFFVKRGKQKILFDGKRPFNTQERPVASNRSSVGSRYNHSSYQSSYQSQYPARSTETTRYGQSSSYSQPPHDTKICTHCKQTVRNDLNVCPYCYKRLR